MSGVFNNVVFLSTKSSFFYRLVILAFTGSIGMTFVILACALPDAKYINYIWTRLHHQDNLLSFMSFSMFQSMVADGGRTVLLVGATSNNNRSSPTSSIWYLTTILHGLGYIYYHGFSHFIIRFTNHISQNWETGRCKSFR